MSSQKEKKIRRLHRKNIWPSMLTLFLFISAFVFIICSMFILSLVNLATNKLEYTTENAKMVAQIIEEENVGSNEELIQLVKEMQRILPNVQEVCISNEENEVIIKSGSSEPKVENELVVTGLDCRIYLLEQSDNTLYAQNGEVKFDTEKMIDVFLAPDDEVYDIDKPLLYLSFWIASPMDENHQNVFVKSEIAVKESEVASIGIFAIAIIGLVIGFAIYYIVFTIGLIRDQRRLTQLLYLNPVTGGKNWTYLKVKGEKFIRKSFRNKIKYALIHIRMNKYQSFCTCYGAKEGTDLLELIYQELQSKISKNEVAVHYARADYAMLLSYDSKEGLEQRLSNIVAGIGAARQGRRLDFCAGIYEINNGKMDMDAMYNNASIARSALHPEGEEWIGWYSQEMQKQQLWERKVEDTMEEALQRKEFQVYLQPKYSSREEKLSGAEALVRWISPEEGFVPPNRFIPIFENNGFILKLDDYMISEVAKQQAEWIGEGRKVVPISVNVSRAHFTKDDLAEHICGLVDAYQVPHEVIELELTESAFFEDKEVLLETVRKLREYGFAVSMDDFGAGYSSLNSLKELPLDVIKLDAEFFRGIEDTEKGKIIVNEAICLAKRLDMKIVAEGIETKEQVDFLAEQGCDLIQGYYFAKPMPIQEFEKKAFNI
ncbi:MAG: GGDEF domain-containing protein [Lachnospiraceae bacterium]|nr:GGDEF domain-containing protein [Lachnospiraceae bacterium]